MGDAASQVVLASLGGKEITDEERAFFREESPAGITLFRWNIPEPYQLIKHIIADLQSLRPKGAPPFIIAIDQEGGRVSRLPLPFPNLGPAQSLFGGDSDAAALAKVTAYAADVGSALVQLGINVNFAPVCDILTEPSNKAIGDRVFGLTPATATLRAGAFLKGLQSVGVLGSLKHFPGQGNARNDTHLASCEIDLSDEELSDRELVPFKALAPSAPMVMLSHCIFPAWDHAPASLSKIIIDDILKGRCKFEGLVVSDDMIMDAIPQSGTAWEDAIVAAVANGVDLVLVCKHLSRAKSAISALRREAAQNSSFATRLEDAAAKVMAMRRRLVT